MKLALIQCDYVPTQLRSQFGDYPLMFEKAFDVFDRKLDWTVIDICRGKHRFDVKNFDAFIISGSRSSVNDSKSWIDELVALINKIVDNHIPLVGLCFGHQAIAKALGGKVSKSKTGWNIGCVPIRLLACGQNVFDMTQDRYLYAFHQDQIEILPKNASCLGTTTVCRNFIVEFQKGVLGFQGHPEFDDTYMHALLDINIADLDSVRIADIKQTLDQASHSKAVRRFILDYLEKNA